jgi:hypothetical protein
MRVAHHKLVRDQIPQIIAADGGRPVTRVLDQAGYRLRCAPSCSRRPAKRRKHRTGGWHRSWLTSWKYSRPSPRLVT